MSLPILSIDLPSATGRVLSIQSHTVQGYVGNKSAVFPLQVLGYDVDPINSVQFSNHTGYPTFKGQVLNEKELRQFIEFLEENNMSYYTHLLTGYIGSVSLLDMVVKVYQKLHSMNPKLIYVCDPVMGDGERLYVPQELVTIYREMVVPVTSMSTLNHFEAEQLSRLRIESEEDARDACNILHAVGPSMVVITSLSLNNELLLIGSYQTDEFIDQFKIVIPKIPAYFMGTGDLMSALLLAWSNNYPDDLDSAAEHAVATVQNVVLLIQFELSGLLAILRRTMEDYKFADYDPESMRSLDIRLIQCREDIKNPKVEVKAEKYNMMDLRSDGMSRESVTLLEARKLAQIVTDIKKRKQMKCAGDYSDDFRNAGLMVEAEKYD